MHNLQAYRCTCLVQRHQVYQQGTYRMISHELFTLAQTILTRHGAEVTTLACLIHLTRQALTEFTNHHGGNMTPLLDAQRRYLRFWMEHHEVAEADVNAAVVSLGQAAQTMDYLSKIPA